MSSNSKEEKYEVHKRDFNVQWIRAESGNTYLCPVNALRRVHQPTEEQLKLICVEESTNPQND